MSFANLSRQNTQTGFSLIEMAIVLVILGALLGGMLVPLSSQREASQRQATERQLQEIRNALIGFAQANGRLPCPVTSTNGNAASNAGACQNPSALAFYVPYAALGIQGTVINGNLVDAWQQPIRYRLANPGGAWAYATGPTIPTASVTPTALTYFQICSAAGACPTAAVEARTVVAVVFSTGEIDHTDSAEESQNKSTVNTSSNFVHQAPEQDFNDLLVWISHPSLIYGLSRAGQ